MSATKIPSESSCAFRQRFPRKRGASGGASPCASSALSLPRAPSAEAPNSTPIAYQHPRIPVLRSPPGPDPAPVEPTQGLSPAGAAPGLSLPPAHDVCRVGKQQQQQQQQGGGGGGGQVLPLWQWPWARVAPMPWRLFLTRAFLLPPWCFSETSFLREANGEKVPPRRLRPGARVRPLGEGAAPAPCPLAQPTMMETPRAARGSGSLCPGRRTSCPWTGS